MSLQLLSVIELLWNPVHRVSNYHQIEGTCLCNRQFSRRCNSVLNCTATDEERPCWNHKEGAWVPRRVWLQHTPLVRIFGGVWWRTSFMRLEDGGVGFVSGASLQQWMCALENPRWGSYLYWYWTDCSAWAGVPNRNLTDDVSCLPQRRCLYSWSVLLFVDVDAVADWLSCQKGQTLLVPMSRPASSMIGQERKVRALINQLYN